MDARRLALALAMAFGLGACATLGAERPLFAVSDQGAAPIAEGVWIAVGEQCSERQLRNRGRFPKDCSPIEIRRAEDGAWLITLRTDLMHGLNEDERERAEEDRGPHRYLFVPAVERTLPSDTYAPLYIGESQPADLETETPGYTLIAPIGAMPATEMRIIVAIDCNDIMRDGPIEGVTLSYRVNEATGEQTIEISSCTAATQAAVREAARRALVEDVEELLQTRFVRARP